MARTLVAGVGYDNLRDLSVGPAVVARLHGRGWGPRVEVHDMSYGAVAALHWFRENPDVDAAVFVAAVERGQEPGTVRRYLRGAVEASPEEVQMRVAEAVTGIVSLETLLTVVGHFGALPPRVVVLEVEPGETGAGAGLSAPVAAALDAVEAMVGDEVGERVA